MPRPPFPPRPPPSPPAALNRVVADDDTVEPVEDAVEVDDRARARWARAGEDAEGTGDPGVGEAGAAVVEAQVEAGDDDDACTESEVLDPGVLGARRGSESGSGDGDDDDVVIGGGVSGARYSPPARLKRPRGILLCLCVGGKRSSTSTSGVRTSYIFEGLRYVSKG